VLAEVMSGGRRCGLITEDAMSTTKRATKKPPRPTKADFAAVQKMLEACLAKHPPCDDPLKGLREKPLRPDLTGPLTDELLLASNLAFLFVDTSFVFACDLVRCIGGPAPAGGRRTTALDREVAARLKADMTAKAKGVGENMRTLVTAAGDLFERLGDQHWHARDPHFTYREHTTAHGAARWLAAELCILCDHVLQELPEGWLSRRARRLPTTPTERNMLVKGISHEARAAASPRNESGIELVAGGFIFHGIPHNLTGRPREMLEALVNAAPHHRLPAASLRQALGIDDLKVDFPEQVVRDTAKNLRAALRAALKTAGRSCKDPLLSVGRGEELAYALDMPR
jgi:hypothetical protein